MEYNNHANVLSLCQQTLVVGTEKVTYWKRQKPVFLSDIKNLIKVNKSVQIASWRQPYKIITLDNFL